MTNSNRTDVKNICFFYLFLILACEILLRGVLRKIKDGVLNLVGIGWVNLLYFYKRFGTFVAYLVFIDTLSANLTKCQTHSNDSLTVADELPPLSTTRVPMATKLSRNVTYFYGLLPLTSYDHLITWSCDITWQTSTVISSLP